MSDLIDTTEMYLKAIYELLEEGVPVLRARIVERLGQSGPTVSETVARMERDGLVRVESNREVALTDDGLATATAVMRRHRLAERLLLDVIKVDYRDVHNEACRWEHVISDDVAEKIDALLGHPARDPFGNPIPGASSSIPGAGNTFDGRLANLAEPSLVGSTVTIERIGELLQVDGDMIRDLVDARIFPGESVEVLGVNPVVVRTASGDVQLPSSTAVKVFVTSDK